MTITDAEVHTLERLASDIRSFWDQPYVGVVGLSVSPDEVRTAVRKYTFAEPVPLDAVYRDARALLLSYTEHGTHPMHFGLFRPAVDLPSIVADALVALHDPNLALWDFSPAAVEMEQHALGVIAKRFGLDPDSAALHFTSGGQEANQTALAVALTDKFPSVARDGIWSLSGQPVFYLSTEGHHSFDKAAHGCGIGRAAIRYIPVDAELRMDTSILDDTIAKDRADGLLPFMIVGTAGTTGAGVIDSLSDLAELARRRGLWFHTDASWGGAAAVSDLLRPCLAGIERSDSITCDAHKWFSVPVGAGMFFAPNREAVKATFTTRTGYVPEQATDSRVYPYVESMQWSRRFIGLKLFMMLATRGLPEIACRIERQTALGDYLRECLTERGWDVVNSTRLPVVCFSHRRFAGDPAAPARIAQRLRARGEAWVSRLALPGNREVIRACVTNYRTSEADIEELVRLVDREVERT